MVVENSIMSLPTKAQCAYGSTVHRAPLDPTRYGGDTATACWLSPTGLARSLPTNVRDIPHTINNNSLRSKRSSGFGNALGEGGNTFNAGVNVDNFVEERADKSYSSGTVPSIVRCKKMYQTESMERQSQALPAYREALAAQGLAAKAVHGQDYRSRHRIEYAPDYLGYAKEGFVRGTGMKWGDATAPNAQGSAWVGTAPVHQFKTVQGTMLSGEAAEFQKIHPSASGAMKIVVGCTKDGKPPLSAALDHTMGTCRAGEVHASQWQSMYSTEISKQQRL